jgi:hypothetical protein
MYLKPDLFFPIGVATGESMQKIDLLFAEMIKEM